MIERYLLALERATGPRSRDFSRSAIYSFPKYCKRCNCGMKRPAIHERRVLKTLFKVGFCSDKCQDIGAAPPRTFRGTTSQPMSGVREPVELEELLDAAIAIMKQKKTGKTLGQLVRDVDLMYNMLSEKLSMMEMFTGQQWGASKFFYHLRRK